MIHRVSIENELSKANLEVTAALIEVYFAMLKKQINQNVIEKLQGYISCEAILEWGSNVNVSFNESIGQVLVSDGKRVSTFYAEKDGDLKAAINF